MNDICVGGEYKTKRYRNGHSSTGMYELFAIRDEKDANEITVFTKNGPFPVESETNPGRIKLLTIYRIKNGSRRGTDGKWYPSVSIDADVEYLGKAEEDDWTSGDADGELPWNQGKEASWDAVDSGYELPL